MFTQNLPKVTSTILLTKSLRFLDAALTLEGHFFS